MKNLFLSLLVSCLAQPLIAEETFPDPVNTQAAGEHPPSPREMLELFDLPPGFHVTLFAGEPDVQQPIAFDFDDRGRIWVAENYSYGAHGKFDSTLRDRIVILHDTDGDGEHDQRRVFWDKGWMLTGLTWGYGGLWILNDGTLSFIPDRDGDDIPDGEPVEMLNGWTKGAGHNVVNGLLWGPDGWLYGRHGITETSLPGTPDTPQAERQPMNCGIWRFHPVQHTFEVVCRGTTNPWGLDYNEDGDFFMSNNVIGHLWHVIPGAHYERMFGQDFDPHLYELMQQTADHYHWDDTGRWNESRDGSADHLGGGHSHCGLLIYQGENLPLEYRGQAFMCNTHGRCVNVDRLEHHGSSYVAKHEPNLLKVNSPWFRGVTLKTGPAGCLYLSDWSDNGECHDHDGVHRTSGRIYRICYGDANKSPAKPDSNFAARRSHRQLLEQAASSSEAAATAVRQFQDRFEDARSRHDRIFALHGLLALKALDENIVGDALQDADPRIVAAAIRLGAAAGAFNSPAPEPGRPFGYSVTPLQRQLHQLAATDQGRIFQALVAALHQMEDRSRLLLAHQTVSHLQRWQDKNLTRLTWFAFTQETSPAALLYLVSGRTTPPRLLRFVARRIVQLDGQVEDVLLHLLSTGGPAKDSQRILAVLTGMLEGYRGRRKVEPPAVWSKVNKRLTNSDDPQIATAATRLSALFGSGAALSELRDLLADRAGDHAARSQAVAALARSGDAKSLPLLLSLLTDRAVYADVAAALANFDDPRVPKELLKRWNNLRHGAREAAADTMVSRKSYAIALAAALDEGSVAAEQLTAIQVRRLLSFGDPQITDVVEARWGVINDSSEAKAAVITNWKQFLTPGVLAQADVQAGGRLFTKTCASCHRMYGEGGRIGPDLTGSNRNNLDYLLGNIVDPSAVVPKQFTVSTIALDSGRIVNGVVVSETDKTITVQTDKAQQVIAVADIDERIRTGKSLMPDGLLDPLTAEQVRDLIGFLQQRR